MSQLFQRIVCDAAWYCFSARCSAIPCLISSRSSPPPVWPTAKLLNSSGPVSSLKANRSKGKAAAVRPDSLMLTKCSAIIRQKQHIIAWYSWKAKLSAGCLPRGICEWLWWQRAPRTEVVFMLWSWVQDKASTAGKSAQAGSFVKERGCRNCPQGPLPGEGTGRNLQRKAAENCVIRKKVSWGLPFYQNTEIVC